MEERVRFQEICKSVPGVRALDRISFGVEAGTVQGLIGENGAGKSTLLKILSGAYRPDSGQVLVDGKPHVFRNTRDADQAGVSIIYQELNLVPEMTVAENILLGMLPNRAGLVDRRATVTRAREQLQRLALDVSPTTKVKRLSIAQRQMVEIGKALIKNGRIIAFDEPTSSLSAREVRKLFETIQELKTAGYAILYVSHRMEEIFEVCDGVTVFRDGKLVKQYPKVEGVTREMLVADMVGRTIHDVYGYRPRQVGEVMFEAKGILGKGLTSPASFQVRRGEVVGFFGLVGAGRTELMKLVFAAERMREGHLVMDGKPQRFGTVRKAIQAGVMLCPEDRKLEGIVPVRPVAENINLGTRRNFSPFGLIRPRSEVQNATRFVVQLRIRTPSLRQLIMNLSGGNQQKVILARWLGEKLRVLLMDEPTRGIDVGAKNEIYNLIYKLAESGVGMVVVSSD
ncbi:MAG TPA: L-arabinose ABC transporter ATP-binding protein AraG, partial [Myxococcaceae bacterium]|nr:L-arabinose ABC transporter ATP-binding protein AraG [Myxococcaceae bacterium]